MKNGIIACLFISIFLLKISGKAGYAQNMEKPCTCCSPEHRQFDFWLGHWNVYTGDQLAGTNSVVVLQDSCLLRENWISAGGEVTGTSYNFYNPSDHQWHQLWIDNQGGNLQLTGEIEEGRMIMHSGEMKSSKGEIYINRVSWTPNPDGTVRQHWEISKNNGDSWETVFDGLYKRKE